ncbi:MAG: hypothetical protein HOP29_16560 [Phycisphaerales bacterium]|nr:hypothetical protein [Phycisphaerales bacterium]
MAEEQAAHRHLLQNSILSAQIDDAKRDRTERRIGQFLAFGIAIMAFSAGTYAIAIGAEWPGALLGGTGVTGLVMAFLNQRRNERPNAQETSASQESDNSKHA